MKSDKLPAFQFYPGDWRKDPGVQALTYEERGVWFEMICLMHESDQRGVLLLNGKPMPEQALAMLLGLDKGVVKQILTTLLTYGVASRQPNNGDQPGAIYCRRMVRDEELRQMRTEAGKKGGNPALLKGVVNHVVKQNSTPSSSSSSSSSIEQQEQQGAVAPAAGAASLPPGNDEPPALALSNEPPPKPPAPMGALAGAEKLAADMDKANRRRANKPDPLANLAIPILLDTETFRAAWAKWQRFRIEKKCPMTATTAEELLEQFVGWGEARAIAAIKYTIAKGWQGLREPDAPAATGPASGQQLMAMGKVDPNRPGRTPETQLPTDEERSRLRNSAPAIGDDPMRINSRKAVIAYWRRDCRDEEAAGKPISRERPFPWHKTWAEMTPEEKAAKGPQPYGIH